MNRKELFRIIQKKKSFLCVGLDTDINKIPAHLHSAEDPVFEFNKQIVDATHELWLLINLILRFYESLGAKGLGKS